LGARPLLRRSFAFWQALILAGIGSLLGAAIGIVPAWALSASPDIPLAIPWLEIGVVVIVLPAFIATGSWLFTKRRMDIALRTTIA
jgi:hypothetical protein